VSLPAAELMDRRKLQCRVGPDGAHPSIEAHHAIAEAFAEVLTGRSCGEPTAFFDKEGLLSDRLCSTRIS